MTQSRPLVVLTRKLPDKIEARMRELFHVKLRQHDGPMSEPELIEAVKIADVLVPTISDKIDKSLIQQAGKQLKLIANFGNGVDNIDIDEAVKRGIIITNTPNVLTDDTADMAMTLILAFSRRLIEAMNAVQIHSDWPGWAPSYVLGHSITGKKLGIIGMGRIGGALAKRARAFGLDIHYHNRRPVSDACAKQLSATYWQDLDEMLKIVDIISINCPSTPATYHLLSAPRLALMKDQAIIVNTSRGEIIDESALINALEHNQLAGAALDVFGKDAQMRAKLMELAKSFKVILLPHLASATLEGRLAMGERVIINIRAFFDHHRSPDRIIPGL